MPEKGSYLYGVVASKEAADLGEVGLDGRKVYSVLYKNIAAIVHNCEAKAYLSDDKIVVGKWIVSHQGVVDKAWEKFGVIAPVAFDTVIKGGEKTLKSWLEENYDTLVSELTRFVGKAEYGIQIFWDVKKISEEIIGQDEELLELQKLIKASSAGIAYLHKKKMEQILKTRLEEKSFNFFKSAYDTIKEMTNDIVIEKLKPATDGLQMLMNISCLVSKKKAKRLGELLDEINKAGYPVRFTGPWPPYSFVGKEKKMED